MDDRATPAPRVPTGRDRSAGTARPHTLHAAAADDGHAGALDIGHDDGGHVFVDTARVGAQDQRVPTRGAVEAARPAPIR